MYKLLEKKMMVDNADVCPTEILVELKADNDIVPLFKNYEFKTSLDGHESKICLKSKENTQILKKNENYQAILDMSSFRVGEIQESKSSIEMDVIVKQPIRWKTPSPQSMSLISKEASNVIHNLNSYVIFDENDLLNEEVLPIPINFENLDLVDLDHDHLVIDENVFNSDISHQKLVTVHTEEIIVNTEMINKDNIANIPIHHAETEKMSVNIDVISQNSLVNIPINPVEPQHSINKNCNICTPPEEIDPLIYLPGIKKLNESKEILSVKFSSNEIQSDSLVSSEFSVSNEGADDVFSMKHNTCEDKENIGESENQKIIPKNSFVSKMKIVSRETLKNLSNIDHDTSKIDLAKPSPITINKKILTPQIKTSIQSKSVIFQPLFKGKVQLKKTVSAMESINESKLIPRSNSFQSKRESVSSLQKPSYMWNTSFSNSKPNIKHQNPLVKMKSSVVIPSKRYSICTPLKNVAPKPLLTPQLPSRQNHLISRYTPQLDRTSCLSFSKSWQHSSDSYPCFDSKVLRPQNPYSFATSKKPEPSLLKLNSAKQEKQSLQKIQTSHFKEPEKNALSTSNKRRFCSKLSLPSPLPASQNKNLARALFPSMS